MYTIFNLVKDNITVPQAAERYGLHTTRSGLACCPFHDDRIPSMKLNAEYYYCFGCQAAGDVIDLTSQLFGLSPYEAALKLAEDFGLDPDPPETNVLPLPIGPERNEPDIGRCAGVLIDYELFLKKRIEAYAPKDPEADWDKRFCAACHSLPRVTATIDELYDPVEGERTAARLEESGTITRIENYMKKKEMITDGTEAAA